MSRAHSIIAIALALTFSSTFLVACSSIPAAGTPSVDAGTPTEPKPGGFVTVTVTPTPTALAVAPTPTVMPAPTAEATAVLDVEPVLATPTPSPISVAPVTPTPTATATPRSPLNSATPTPAPGPAITPTPVTVTLTASRDATIWQDAASVAAGADSALWVGRNREGQVRRGLIWFNATTRIPAGSTILSVEVEMSVSKNAAAAGSSAAALHRLNAPWGEGKSDARGNGSGVMAQEGDVTWAWRFFNVEPWPDGKGGGDFLATASATSNSTTWSSTTALVGDVQKWVDDASANHGWIVVGDEIRSQSVRKFDSRESTSPPTMTVTYIDGR